MENHTKLKVAESVSCFSLLNQHGSDKGTPKKMDGEKASYISYAPGIHGR